MSEPTIDALFDWQSPYTAVDARVETTLVDTDRGPALRRRVTLPAGATLGLTANPLVPAERVEPRNRPQAELVPRGQVELWFHPRKPFMAALLYGEIGGRAFLYLQDLGALGELMDVGQLPLEPLLIGEGDALGWRGPDLHCDFTARADTLLSCAYLLVDDDAPGDAVARAERFVAMLAALQPHFEPASVEVNDLDELADRSLRWITDEGTWRHLDGQRYLQAYVNAPADNVVECNTPLEILEPLLRFEQATGRSYRLADILKAGLPAFYNDDLGTLMIERPFEEGDEQGDTWYLHTLLAKLAALADVGWQPAADMLRGSLDYAIELAHRVGYEYPLFFRWEDLEPGGGNPNRYGVNHYVRERDTVLGYLYVMVRAWELFGDERCLNEARAAFKHIGRDEFDSVYELHMTAMGCAGLARLARATGEERHRRAALRPLAYLLAHTTLHQIDWGFRGGLPSYMAAVALPYLYPAPMEQHLAAQYLAEWLEVAGDAVPAPARRLAESFIAHSAGMIRASYPDGLPPGALMTWALEFGFRNDPAAPVPVEDYTWQSRPCGMMGHELYGAGAAPDMAVLARQHGARRSVTGRPGAYPWPRGVSVAPGHSDVIEIHGASAPVGADLDGPPGVGLRREPAGERQRLRIEAAPDLAPGVHECVLWLREGDGWHPSAFQLHVRGPVCDWRPERLRDADAWRVRFGPAALDRVDDGLRVTVGDGGGEAVVALPDVLIPPRAVQMRVSVPRCSDDVEWTVVLSQDYNEDGRWPGEKDDAPLPLQAAPATVVWDLPDWVRAAAGAPLRLLQLAVTGLPGSWAVFGAVDFLLVREEA